jgi:hypothetical protein
VNDPERPFPVPVAMPEHDYYQILNVPRNASADEIKKAYKKEVQSPPVCDADFDKNSPGYLFCACRCMCWCVHHASVCVCLCVFVCACVCVCTRVHTRTHTPMYRHVYMKLETHTSQYSL